MRNWQFFFWGAAFKWCCGSAWQNFISFRSPVLGWHCNPGRGQCKRWVCVSELQLSATITITTTYQSETENGCLAREGEARRGILRTYICPLSHSAAALNCLVLLTLLPSLSGPPGGNFHVEMMHDGLNRLASASAAANWLANCAKTVASSTQI